MLIKIGSEEYTVEPQERTWRESPHTGRALRSFTSKVTVHDNNLSSFEKSLEDAKKNGVAEIDFNSNELAAFNITVSLLHHVKEEKRRVYNVQFEETEIIDSVEALILGGVSFEPYEYKENVEDDGTISIEAKVELNQEQINHMHTLREDDYFEVIRKGIDDCPKQMRFGRNVWSEDPDGEIREYMILVEKDYDRTHDVREHPYPDLPNMKRKLANSSATLHLLLEQLSSKGILETEDLEQMSLKLDKERAKQMRDLFEVNNIHNEKETAR